MNIKFTRPFSDYKYILSFDLAKKLSGYSLLDIENNKIILTGTIDTGCMPKNDLVWNYLYNQIFSIISRCIEKIGDENTQSLLITKEQLPVQNGRFSTIATLQSLAQVHAIFDLAAFQSDAVTYDDIGIHSVAVKAYFRKLLDVKSPQKEDIAEYIYKKYPDYNFKGLPLDVTDSIAVSLTLINKKWNADIQSEIANIKKEIKNSKTQNKITRLEDEIKRLQSLKSDKEEE